ncbi:MAG: sel1 repeat family protein [Kofleriaceae bacterium]|nr:sel1 repeat family protein [Kofleriaceae bacterium]
MRFEVVVAALALIAACKGPTSRKRTPPDATAFGLPLVPAMPVDAQAVDAAPAQSACELHDEPKCLDYALALAFGTGMPADMPAAVKLMEASCDRLYMRSCIALTQIGLPAAETLKYARHGCAIGEVSTCGMLVGLFNDQPIGAGQFAFARDQLAKRCDAKDADACWALSGIYWVGRGTPKNRAKAGQLIERACQLGAHCEVRDRWKKGGGFFEDLGPIPAINILPLVDPHKQRP